MTTEMTTTNQEDGKVNVKVQSASDAVYGLGMIGAWIFYIGRARTPKDKVIGFLKGFVWPVFLVYEVLKLLHPQEPDSPDLPIG
jgi:hypothetical protein